VGIGIWAARRVQSEADFLVAGRGLGYPLTIFSVFATWFGAESCIASAARAYHEGFSLRTAEPFGYGLCLILMGALFAVPLWRRRLTTFADLFRERYGPGVEKTAALIMVPSSIFWAAAQLRGFGHVLSSITTLDIWVATAVATGFCVVYTMFGGMLADVVTDLVQGVVVVIGLLVLAVAMMLRADHPAAIVPPAVPAVPASAGPLALLEEWAIPVVGSIVAVEMVSRVIAARSPQVARNGTMVAGGLYIAAGLIPLFIGLSAARQMPGMFTGEELLPSLARRVLPSGLYVLLAGALISAILSTVNTILLVSAGLVSHNVLAPALRLENDRARLVLARAGTVFFGIIGWFLAVRAEGIGDLVEEASAFGSAGIVVVTAFALFSRRGGSAAAMATLLGALTVYLAAAWGGASYPFLMSLAAAVVLYAGGVLLER